MKNNIFKYLSLLLILLSTISTTQAQTCAATAVTPYIKIAGTWSNVSSATISSGTQIVFGPTPLVVVPGPGVVAALPVVHANKRYHQQPVVLQQRFIPTPVVLKPLAHLLSPYPVCEISPA